MSCGCRHGFIHHDVDHGRHFLAGLGIIRDFSVEGIEYVVHKIQLFLGQFGIALSGLQQFLVAESSGKMIVTVDRMIDRVVDPSQAGHDILEVFLSVVQRFRVVKHGVEALVHPDILLEQQLQDPANLLHQFGMGHGSVFLQDRRLFRSDRVVPPVHVVNQVTKCGESCVIAVSMLSFG